MDKVAAKKSQRKEVRRFEIPPRSVKVKGAAVEIQAHPAFEGVRFPAPKAKPDKHLDLSKVQLVVTVAAKYASPQVKARNPEGNPWGAALVGTPSGQLVALAKMELWHHLVTGPAREHYVRPISDAVARILSGLKELRVGFDGLENTAAAAESYASACLFRLPETLESLEEHLPRLELLSGFLAAGLRPATDPSEPQLEAWRVLMRAARYTERQIAELEVKAEVYCYEKEIEAREGLLRPNQPPPISDSMDSGRRRRQAEARFIAAEVARRPDLEGLEAGPALQHITKLRTVTIKTALSRFRMR